MDTLCQLLVFVGLSIYKHDHTSKCWGMHTQPVLYLIFFPPFYFLFLFSFLWDRWVGKKEKEKNEVFVHKTEQNVWAGLVLLLFPSFWVGHRWIDVKKKKVHVHKTEQNGGRFSFALCT